jgi:hypothetical protein
MKRIILDSEGKPEITFDVTLVQYCAKPKLLFAALMDDDFEIEGPGGVTIRGKRNDYLARTEQGTYLVYRKEAFQQDYERKRSPQEYYKSKEVCGGCKHWGAVPSGKAHYGKCHKQDDGLMNLRTSACSQFEEG